MSVMTKHINCFHLCSPGLRSWRQLTAAASGAVLLVALLVSLLVLLLGLQRPAAAQNASAPAAAASAAALRYRVVNLGPGELSTSPAINASGQVAFSFSDGAAQRAWFFDGKRLQSIGSLGGALVFSTGLNDSGQICGYAQTVGDGLFHAFRWSAGSGIRDLGTLDGGESSGQAINAGGDVVGYSGGQLRPIHAFRWSASAGMIDLGSLANDVSSAVALNDSGLISGFSNTASGDTHAFVWTRARGIEDIGTLGGTVSYPEAVAARGEVSGFSEVAQTPGLYHAFFWTRAGGMHDLGTLNGSESFVLAMNRQAQIAGVINVDSGYQRAIFWTAATGMRDLGTFGGPGARAQGLNGKGQVVGFALDRQQNLRAFLWSEAQGLADLNTRLVNAPAGLLLDDAVAIADNGAIVATSNAGLVLLRPLGQDNVAAPVVGPVDVPALIRVGSAATVKVAFNDSDSREQHRASLQWGDATMETALVSESGGAGSAWASHIYRAPGVYTIIAKVTDNAGNTTTVRREVVVAARQQHGAGSGTLLSPQGADRRAPARSGPAAFSFVAPGVQAATGKVQFDAARLAFRSITVTVAPAAQDSELFTGVGQLNGKDGYSYALTVAPGSAAQGRFHLRIWHADARSGAALLDYDNGQTRAAQRGTLLSGGAIALAP